MKSESISDIPIEALVCRELGHAWDWSTDLGAYIELGRVLGVTRTLVCGRCTTKRTETVSVVTGARSHASYKYADGYLMKEPGRILADDVRLEWLRRMGKA